MSIKPLRSGDTIGVMAPSSYVEQEDIEKSARILEARGYKVFIHPQTYARQHQSAGTHADKLDALHALFRRDDIDMIWMAGGGNRALHIIDKIDYGLIKANPKPVIGFSDVTAILNAIYAHTDLGICVHGPVFKQLHKHKDFEQCLATLALSPQGLEVDLSTADFIREGHAHAPIVGGNLSIFQYLPQTLPHNFAENKIILLEDCGEELSKIDRMLAHLKRSGVLSSAAGLIFGEFSDIKDTGRPFGYSLREIIEEHCEGLNIPIVMNTPIGHAENLRSTWLGNHYFIDSSNKKLNLKSK
ncbi:MAG: LD-carboxypeptidase [Micavibrio sp.]|mgnify:CR=1 FL=1|nr:LD-carboxypeptidase [Micavibrio sp.]|tara:strand:+ start:1281 stop:2180 length:900 start_codon:yes stop_codon:yes gene_type:complete